MESNKSIHRSDEQRNLYKALFDAYECNKIILDTYGDTVTLKRHHDGEDKDEEPFARSDRGSMRRQVGKEPDSTSAADNQPVAEASQHPEWFQKQTKPLTPDPDHAWNKTLPATHRSIQPWISDLAKQADSRTSFNELMDTHSLVDLEFFLEEVYKATTDQLDWNNPEGYQYLHNLLKPLPLIPNSRGVKIYQKKINLTKPDAYRSDLKRKEAYTAYSNPRGFVYQNKDKKNRLMRIDELHKFNDGKLNDVRTALDDRLKGTRMKKIHTLAGNPVKEILLKLNLPDHRTFKDGGEDYGIVLSVEKGKTFEMKIIKKIKKSERFMAAMRNVLMVDLFFMFNYIENIERSLAYNRRVSSSNKQEKPDGSKVKLVRGGAEYFTRKRHTQRNDVANVYYGSYCLHASAIGQLTKRKNSEGKEIARLVDVALEKDYKHIDSSKEMLGTFDPQAEPYIHAMPEEVTPLGMLGRGNYSAKTKSALDMVLADDNFAIIVADSKRRAMAVLRREAWPPRYETYRGVDSRQAIILKATNEKEESITTDKAKRRENEERVPFEKELRVLEHESSSKLDVAESGDSWRAKLRLVQSDPLRLQRGMEM
uniref:Rho GDP-dissociation inhibitor 1-like n=1 Tax=Tanacetum cinerariifolium TaxID=118510 RepID=A0A6L2JV31_TANCI|nr:Rho GDP-dissociation inhibitor 1-like [Tanacetum cinerariifolium]